MDGRPVINTLSVASECVPLVKTGGLADVVGALPGALAAEGVMVRTLMPGYPAVMSSLGKPETLLEIKNCFGGPARVHADTHQGLDLLVLDAPHLYDRGHGIYMDGSGGDWPDNAERFAALSRVAANIARVGLAGWRPAIVHCHDWQAGLAPYYMKKSRTRTRSLMTIHNIMFQGTAPLRKRKALGIAPKDAIPEGLEYFGGISALKAGLVYADKLNTVSPTYADELMLPEFGMGLDGVLRARGDDFSGILNGIDDAVWSPGTDPHIAVNYTSPEGKAANKDALRKELGLPDSDGPLCVVVSRLAQQKGLDLLLEAWPALTWRGGQLALLGSGDPALERGFKAIDDPNVSVRIGYDEALSHRMFAGGDAVLVPSRFEPCGLTQLYGLRYGALPVVALTGGLADTVIPATPATMAMEAATGVQFTPVTSHALSGALTRLCGLYEKPELWARLQSNAMRQPVSWATSAAAYAALYRELAE